MSPSGIHAESRPVRPIVSEENELLESESVKQAPQWAKYMIAFQQQSEQRLQNLESAVKKLYQEQYDFNMSLYRTLENAIQVEDKEEIDAHLLTGIGFIEKRNKILMLSDKHGWECAEAYSAIHWQTIPMMRRRLRKL